MKNKLATRQIQELLLLNVSKPHFSPECVTWRLPDGTIHREDGPAIIYTRGREEWYFRGVLHREDGPAITYADGTQEWYELGCLHREDGPARIESGGDEYYHLFGFAYSPFEYRLRKSPLLRKTYSKLKDFFWHLKMAVKFGEWGFHWWTPKSKLGFNYVFYDGHNYNISFYFFSVSLFY